MHDFSTKYRGVAHFGLWAEESADQLGNRDAWAILCDAVRQCTTKDLREVGRVEEALQWFERRLCRPRPVEDFRKALDICDPMQRYFAAQDALTRIGRYSNLIT